MTYFKTAIIDIGSNTIRLVLYTYDPQRGLKEVENIKAVARLRNYLQADHVMTEEGIQKLEQVLLFFRDILNDYRIEDVRAIATASIRQAQNGTEIIERMLKKTGIKIELITGEQEAYFGYFAVAHTLATPSAVTIDIGGGSTELTYFRDKELQYSHSFPFGSVSLKQQFIEGDTMTKEEGEKIYEFAKKKFEILPWLNNIKLPVVGIGGSARNMAKLDQRKKDYPISGVHQYEMTKEDFTSISQEVLSLSFEELMQLDGLSSDRADIIVPVLEVFQALMDVVGSETFQFSRKGLREGLVIERILKKNPTAFNKKNVFERSTKFLAAEFDKPLEKTAHFVRLTEIAYFEFCKIGAFLYNAEDLHMLKQAARLFHIGEYIEVDAASQHTFYLLSNRSIDGISHEQRVHLALLASYKNRDDFSRYSEPFMEWFSKGEFKKMRDIGALLKFVYALDASKRNIVESIAMEQSGDNIELTIFTTGNAMAEMYQADRQKKHINRIFKGEVTLHYIKREE
ncbi:Ppx/GppA family phosphatase [Viridibacillus sp. YIM B01967]|uniref:Ppx/GppA family phosphatase n=1 Tax=Viridibacillus soli TaxID=2798301 RepID=A0ABS1H7S5_9BACL|nr:Ppx/GppA family phosphatase [Viridibacillus soli]MBK3495366.1 Ppx/GppA family phosphatase [Viridibacillus soli]